MASINNKKHNPVMLHEILEYLVPESGKQKIVDCTLGYGGHSEQILKKNKELQLIGIDKDDDAIKSAKNLLDFASSRVKIVKGRFSSIKEILENENWDGADAFLLDLGVSSPQIDNPERGFSYSSKGPLDMRMDRKDEKLTAAQILNYSGEEELTRIFRDYGEMKFAKKLAKVIVSKRKQRPWVSTDELANLCKQVVPYQRRTKMPLPTLCFQALRIAVNGELKELENTVNKIIPLLNKKGRIGVISYHSLEDRIVKNIFKKEASECICPPELPVCRCEHKRRLKILTKRPITAKDAEVDINPRARSAKLRVAEKI